MSMLFPFGVGYIDQASEIVEEAPMTQDRARDSKLMRIVIHGEECSRIDMFSAELLLKEEKKFKKL